MLRGVLPDKGRHCPCFGWRDCADRRVSRHDRGRFHRQRDRDRARQEGPGAEKPAGWRVRLFGRKQPLPDKSRKAGEVQDISVRVDQPRLELGLSRTPPRQRVEILLYLNHPKFGLPRLHMEPVWPRKGGKWKL